jgi:DNA polymerase-3 subunit chi
VTRVDFYILPDDSDRARLLLACRIAEKAMLRNQRVFIHSAPESARELDELLWTFSQGSFVPHRIVSGAEADDAPEPVLIGTGECPSRAHWEVLINLADQVPEFFSRYERVVEPVDGNAARRQQSRERYKFYRDRGYPLATHQL